MAGVLAIAVGLTVVLCLSGWIIARLSIRPPRLRARGTPAAFGADYEDVEFLSRAGGLLSGWYAQAAEPRGTVVLAHGMVAERSQMLPWAQWLWREGWSILLFDFRALGKSEGNLCTMGLLEPGDVLGALDFLRARKDAAGQPTVLFGFSMGGVAAIIAASQDPNVAAVVAHGAYATLDGAISQRCRRHFGPLAPPVEWAARHAGRRWYPGDSATVRTVDSAARLCAPLLVVNGARDPIVPPANAEALAAAAPHSDLLILPSSGHAWPHPRDEPAYRARVSRFLANIGP